jgi:hypothetical protein
MARSIRAELKPWFDKPNRSKLNEDPVRRLARADDAVDAVLV